MSASVMVAPPPGSSNSGTTQRSGALGGQLAAGACALDGQGAAVGAAVGSAGAGPLVSAAAPPAVLADLLQLTKPRIVTMILVTAIVAALVAAGPAVSPLLLLHLVIGLALVAGSAGAMNQVWEWRIDGQMERTRRRPLPAGRVGLPLAIGFAIAIGVVGTVYLVVTVGLTPALLAMATWILYVPIYTPLKVRSEWNTTVGALSGALPVMIGYTAAGGRLSDPSGWLLVGVLVAWQYPHFMAIAWLFRRQYGEAGFQMTTTIEPTGRRAGWQSVLGMAALAACLVALAVILTPASLVGSVVLSLLVLAVTYPMAAAAIRFALRRDDLTARRLLRASLLQLPASLLLLTFAALFFKQ
jgi:heme o synthase